MLDVTEGDERHEVFCFALANLRSSLLQCRRTQEEARAPSAPWQLLAASSLTQDPAGLRPVHTRPAHRAPETKPPRNNQQLASVFIRAGKRTYHREHCPAEADIYSILRQAMCSQMAYLRSSPRNMSRTAYLEPEPQPLNIFHVFSPELALPRGFSLGDLKTGYSAAPRGFPIRGSCGISTLNPTHRDFQGTHLIIL